jgi:hypothetical protein
MGKKKLSRDRDGEKRKDWKILGDIIQNSPSMKLTPEMETENKN